MGGPRRGGRLPPVERPGGGFALFGARGTGLRNSGDLRSSPARAPAVREQRRQGDLRRDRKGSNYGSFRASATLEVSTRTFRAHRLHGRGSGGIEATSDEGTGNDSRNAGPSFTHGGGTLHLVFEAAGSPLSDRDSDRGGREGGVRVSPSRRPLRGLGGRRTMRFEDSFENHGESRKSHRSREDPLRPGRGPEKALGNLSMSRRGVVADTGVVRCGVRRRCGLIASTSPAPPTCAEIPWRSSKPNAEPAPATEAR